MYDRIQPTYAPGVRCAAWTLVARSTHRMRLGRPPPGESLAKSTTYSGWLLAMPAMSCSSRGSTWPVRSAVLACAENLIWPLVTSWAPAPFLRLSVEESAALYAAAPSG